MILLVLSPLNSFNKRHCRAHVLESVDVHFIHCKEISILEMRI